MEINPLYPALISGFIGAIIGGLITLIATLFNQRHQQKLQQQKLDHERKTILASQRFKFLVDLYTDFIQTSNDYIIDIGVVEKSARLTNMLNIKIHQIISFTIATNDPLLKASSQKLLIYANETPSDEDMDENVKIILALQKQFSRLIGEVTEETFDISLSKK